MNIRHADKKMERMEFEFGFHNGFGVDVVKAFRRRMQFIRDAEDERDFYAAKSLHYEKLKGNRSHQRSMRLNDQYRLVLQIEREPGGNTVVIISIEDYH